MEASIVAVLPQGTGRAPPETTNYNIETMYRYLTGDARTQIVIDHDIQRGEVWNHDKQALLIDSILRGYPIHPILLLKDVKVSKLICYDGKQRLSSIRNYIDNVYPLKTTSGVKVYFSTVPSNAKGTSMTVEQQNYFMCLHPFSAIEHNMDSFDVEQRREIFRRIQQGSALTRGEMLVTMATPFVKYVNELAEKYEARLAYLFKARVSNHPISIAGCYLMYYYGLEVSLDGFHMKKVPLIEEHYLGHVDALVDGFEHILELAVCYLESKVRRMYNIAMTQCLVYAMSKSTYKLGDEGLDHVISMVQLNHKARSSETKTKLTISYIKKTKAMIDSAIDEANRKPTSRIRMVDLSNNSTCDA